MSVVVRRGWGSRQAWWGVLALLLLMGGWVARPMLRLGAPGEAEVPGGLTPSEQSLEVLDKIPLGPGAPGAPIDLSMDGASSPHRPSASGLASLDLAPVPGAPRAPGTADKEKGLSAGAQGGKEDSSLAAALKKAAGIGKTRDAAADPSGWGGRRARTGFSPPRANFGGMGGLGGSGAGGGTGASGASVPASAVNPFGAGSSSPGESAAAGMESGPLSSPRIKSGTNRAFSFLKGADAKAQLAAASPSLERSAGYGSKTYDAGGVGGALTNAGAPGGVGLGRGVPDNLKINDPKLADKKEIIPPAVPEAEEVKGDDWQQMVTMMLLQAAIGGILGPVFGGVGMAMAGSMGLTPPDGDYGKVNYNAQTGSTGRN